MKKIIVVCAVALILVSIILTTGKEPTGATADVGQAELVRAYEEAGHPLPEAGLVYTEQRKSNYCFDEGCDCVRSVHNAWFWDDPDVEVVWIE